MKFSTALERVKQDSSLMMRLPKKKNGTGFVWRESKQRIPALFSVEDHKVGARVAICDPLVCEDRFHDDHKDLVRKDWKVVKVHLVCSACGHAL